MSQTGSASSVHPPPLMTPSANYPPLPNPFTGDESTEDRNEGNPGILAGSSSEGSSQLVSSTNEPEQLAKHRSVHHNDDRYNSQDTNLPGESQREEGTTTPRARPMSGLSGGGRLPRKSATHLLLYTRAVPLPKRFETVTEYRFLMRMTQSFMAVAAFASLATASFNVNYTSAVLAVSGINLMTFTSISSLFVSFGCIIVYCFPAFIGVAPHRHPRFSRVEVAVDLVYLGFWLAAPSVLVWYGRCPRLTFSTAPDAISCLPWNMCTAFGFASAALFLGTFIMGFRDLARYGLWNTGRGNGVMWARGSWKEWAET
ncbi:hypothetical protein DFJ77DRAFT_450690 [Powellomyces hirtus]|nr:hypothetical protein DFJ77DRAFT_450690 [Powellomyces hirtus]